jgi:hypothetical protein
LPVLIIPTIILTFLRERDRTDDIESDPELSTALLVEIVRYRPYSTMLGITVFIGHIIPHFTDILNSKRHILIGDKDDRDTHIAK